MNKNCHRTKSFCSGTLPHRCNSYVSQVSQKWKSISVTLGSGKNYIYKEVSQNKNFLFGDSLCSKTLPLPYSHLKKNVTYILFVKYVKINFKIHISRLLSHPS